MPAGAAGKAPTAGRSTLGRICTVVPFVMPTIAPQRGPAGEAVPTGVAIIT